jgi:flagellar biosynthetic protein FlhB
MAQQDSQDRTQPATPKRISKAREEGQVARSKDLGHFAAIAAGGTALVAVMPVLADWMRQILLDGLRFDAATVHNTGAMTDRLQELMVRMLWVVLPFGALMALTGAGACIAMGGWNFTLKPLLPKFGKLNPLQGLVGIVSKDKLVDVLKASMLAIVLGTIGTLYLKSHVDEFTALLAMPLPAGIQQAASTLLSGVLLLVLALALFAAVDVPLQRFQHAQRLRMSHAEIKQENKEQQGNQEIKGKIRARMREVVKRRMLAAVPTADLVVMNPTHYAVALKYDDGKMAAPRVVAKGADLLAMKIRDLAKDSKVPVLQSPALARALYAHAELDREIPAALFAAVAQVLAHVYQLRAALAGQVAMPADLPELDVPVELDPHHKPVAGRPTKDTE